MRGKVLKFLNADCPKRITPAYAGKSEIGKMYRVGGEDHPRLCGEKSFTPLCESLYIGSPPPMRGKGFGYMTTSKSSGGSPPPMRGKVVRAIPDILRKRITPAYAGKSNRFHRCD